MTKSQVWKKRSAGLATDYRAESTTWMKLQDTDRAVVAVAPGGQRKAGMKRRKY